MESHPLQPATIQASKGSLHTPDLPLFLPCLEPTMALLSLRGEAESITCLQASMVRPMCAGAPARCHTSRSTPWVVSPGLDRRALPQCPSFCPGIIRPPLLPQSHLTNLHPYWPLLAVLVSETLFSIPEPVEGQRSPALLALSVSLVPEDPGNAISLQVQEGQSLCQVCEATGNPSARLSWSWGNLTLKPCPSPWILGSWSCPW